MARPRFRALLSGLGHLQSTQAVRAERAFWRRLGGGCLAPVGGHATLAGGLLRLDAAVGDADGPLPRDHATGSPDDGEAIGEALAVRMLVAGAERLLRRSPRESAAANAPPE